VTSRLSTNGRRGASGEESITYKPSIGRARTRSECGGAKREKEERGLDDSGVTVAVHRSIRILNEVQLEERKRQEGFLHETKMRFRGYYVVSSSHHIAHRTRKERPCHKRRGFRGRPVRKK